MPGPPMPGLPTDPPAGDSRPGARSPCAVRHLPPSPHRRAFADPSPGALLGMARPADVGVLGTLVSRPHFLPGASPPDLRSAAGVPEDGNSGNGVSRWDTGVSPPSSSFPRKRESMRPGNAGGREARPARARHGLLGTRASRPHFRSRALLPWTFGPHAGGTPAFPGRLRPHGPSRERCASAKTPPHTCLGSALRALRASSRARIPLPGTLAPEPDRRPRGSMEA